jgi:hypothetical protein
MATALLRALRADWQAEQDEQQRLDERLRAIAAN